MKACSRGLGVLRVSLLFIIPPFSSSGPLAQDTPPDTLVKLPELIGLKLQDDQFLVFNCRVDRAHAEFIKNCRMIAFADSKLIPTSLLIDKYLHRKSEAIQDDFCYLESDWLSRKDLEMLASVIRKIALVSRELFDNTSHLLTREVILKAQTDYYAMTDAWSDQELTKKQARAFSSIFVNDYRCGFEDELENVLSLIVTDSVNRNVSLSLRAQAALLEGMHTYISSVLTLHYRSYVSLQATTPITRHNSNVEALFITAREYLARPRHDSLEQILSCELNALTLEKLSVSFALIQFLLEKRMDRWKAFFKVLETESLENGTLKGPEGRRAALAKAVQDGLGLSFPELEKQLQEFTAKEYLYPEEIATVLGLDRGTPESVFQGFVQVCELKRSKKPVTPKGEKIYDEMMKKVDKILQERGEKW